ncbi:MAG: lysostaphin resistance A-like protein [Candidatus Bipolaricaulia bacterium]
MRSKYELSRILKVSAFLLVIIGISNAYAQDDDRVPLLNAIIPGGTHFYEGDIREGLAFLIPEASLFALGVFINDQLETETSQEWSIPWLVAGQLYGIDKWRYFQKSQLRLQQGFPNYQLPIRFDPTPLSELLFAPFNPKVILSPLVLTFAALGIIDGIVAYPKNNENYSDISSVIALSNQMDRETGTYYYESMALVVSYGAAVSEEMMFRGLLLPVLDAQLGKRRGLITTSLIFGLLHLFNSDIDKPLYFVSQATLAGLVFGYHVQRNDYRLSEAIAAHFWYNFVSMTTTWLTNPKENPLGIQVRFEF